MFEHAKKMLQYRPVVLDFINKTLPPQYVIRRKEPQLQDVSESVNDEDVGDVNSPGALSDAPLIDAPLITEDEGEGVASPSRKNDDELK